VPAAPRRVGQYEVLEKLGSGGMGAVYKARHVELGKVVALKVLPADQVDEVRVGRFKNEVRAIGRLDHPHIVAARDAGEFSGVHYLVMDLVDGEDLGRVVERHGRLPIPDACEAIRQAADGLQHAFERGLVHRDIKPSNLMLNRDGRVQVLDLGLARSFRDRPAETLTADGMVLGTADYLAPEQWEHAHSADIRADIYSLGCTLYHFLAGAPPFAGGRFGSILQKLRGHVDTPPPPVTGLRPEVPAGLAAVVDRMLAKDPAGRFGTPAEVSIALRPFTAGADLARLLDATGTSPLPPSEAAATVNPATLDTAVSSRPGLPAPPRRRYVIPAAVAALWLALLAAAILWPRGDKPTEPTKPLTVSELRVTHYRNGASLGEMRKSEPARVKDYPRIAADLSAPAHYYLIAFNPDGADQLCQPADAEEHGAPDVAPKLSEDVRFPRGDHDFELDAPGLQVFVLAVSAKELPSYKEWKDGVKSIPWTGMKDASGEARWHFDRRELTKFEPRVPRGKIVTRDSSPKPLQVLCDFFKDREEFDAVRIFAFTVTSDRK
ncbi:MAG TPA: serine/threonine-protein kinase, partial [Gemmataceae bacterium]|nr:serine/threonine-protein kinase [Gemmataceae bacterium]